VPRVTSAAPFQVSLYGSTYTKAFVTFCLPAAWSVFWERHPDVACTQLAPSHAGACDCLGASRTDAHISIYETETDAAPTPGTLTFCKKSGT
jgi:hypothetical protein